MFNVVRVRAARLAKQLRSDNGIDVIDIFDTDVIIDIDIANLVDDDTIDNSARYHGCRDSPNRGAGRNDDSAARAGDRNTDDRAGHDHAGAAPIGGSGL